MRALVTRPIEDAAPLEAALKARGIEAVVVPMMSITPAGAPPRLDGIAALLFTSANGVRAFAARSGDRALKVFAVGGATAQAARQAGFASVLSSDGDVEALAQGIAARKGELKGAVLHPGAADLAGDLVGALAAQGVETRRLILYETRPTPIPAGELKTLLRCDVVLLHSPRGAQALARVLRSHPAPAMRALGLSKAVLKPLARVSLAAKAAPAFPLEAALLQLIDKDG